MAFYETLKTVVTETESQVQQDADAIVISARYLAEKTTQTPQSWSELSQRSGWTAMMAELTQPIQDAVGVELALLQFVWIAANVLQEDQGEFNADIAAVMAKWAARTTHMPFPTIYAEVEGGSQ